jgi:ribosome maturation factor RimP
MKNAPPSGPVADAVRDVVEAMGYALVEFATNRVNGRTHVHAVLHHPEGVDLDSLSQVHRALQPRLESLLEDRDLRIEFSSPGLRRTVKSFHELQIFKGQPVRLLVRDEHEWLEARILDADEAVCVVVSGDGSTRTLKAETVQKVRLSE